MSDLMMTADSRNRNLDDPTGHVSSRPIVFISYSWTNSSHEEWVLELATELRKIHALDVRLDKWHVGGPGGDPIRFMESIVTDPELQKVLIVSDREYVRKANAREGGAGIEAQIFTPQLYMQSGRDGLPHKYVVVVKENDENGRPCIPAFYGSRLFIDMTDSKKRLAKMEEIVRWAYDQPVHPVPPIGSGPPSICLSRTSRTSAAAKQATEALTVNFPGAAKLTEDYFDFWLENLKELAPRPPDSRSQFSAADQLSMVLIDAAECLAAPYRELESVLIDLALARLGERGYRAFRHLISGLFPLTDSKLSSEIQDWQTDPYDYIVPDIVRAAVAALAHSDDFAGIFALTALDYEVRDRTGFQAYNRSFISLQRSVENAQLRSELPNLRNARGSLFTKDELLQADVLLALIDIAGRKLPEPLFRFGWKADLYGRSIMWEPGRVLPAFGRAESRAFLGQLGSAFGLDSVRMKELVNRAASIDGDEARKMETTYLPYRTLLGVAKIGTRP